MNVRAELFIKHLLSIFFLIRNNFFFFFNVQEFNILIIIRINILNEVCMHQSTSKFEKYRK